MFVAQEDDRKLLKEVGKNGEGRPDEVQQLIDEVTINCSSADILLQLLLVQLSVFCLTRHFSRVTQNLSRES